MTDAKGDGVFPTPDAAQAWLANHASVPLDGIPRDEAELTGHAKGEHPCGAEAPDVVK